MIGLAITCYNSPEKLCCLLKGLQGISALSFKDKWINDQSTDEAIQDTYRAICMEYGMKYVHSPQDGASASKRQILETAWGTGVEFLHQMSEDFEVNFDSSHVALGHDSFLQDSINLFMLDQIDFVKWNVITPPDGDMHYQWNLSSPSTGFNLRKGIKLPFLTGDVVYSNWPSTWRVSTIREMWKNSQSWNPPDEKNANLVRASGGEWAASMSRISKGVCLIAQPLIHSRRCDARPTGSKP